MEQERQDAIATRLSWDTIIPEICGAGHIASSQLGAIGGDIGMENFTPGPAFAGGLLIGLAALLLLGTIGRIAGVSGILSGLLPPTAGDASWRVAFLAGLIAAPAFVAAATGTPPVEVTQSLPLLVAGGLLVGFGTRLGGGCTSGHGICGIARLSPRSIAATAIFMAVAMATVFVMRHLMGS
jgi:hypothetical protein